MTQEEKLKEAKKLYESANADQRYVLESLFPELKESEDEKIRKWIEKELESKYVVDNIVNNEMADKAFAWIKKQCEHANFRNKIQIGDKVTRNEDGVLVNLSQLNRVAKKDEKQGEQKSTNKVEPKFKVGDTIRLKNSNAEYIIESISDSHYYGKGFSISIVGGNRDYELVEKKPTEWSEEDEKHYRSLLCLFECVSPKEEDTCWFKTLKDRVQLQQKWSEEDIVAIDCAVDVLSRDLPSLAASIKRLKSLRPINNKVMKANESVDFFSVHSKEEVAEIDKCIERKQKEYDAKLLDRMMKAKDFPMAD